MISTESKRGIFAVMVAHCAGMLDLVALPVWVGTLVAHYQFDPQQAGGLATLFLVGASLASVIFAPRFTRHDPKRMVVIGFGAACLAFVLASHNTAFPILAALHLGGGLATGLALSFTHGTIGHAASPHRLFAWVSLAIGLFGVAFLGATPGIVERHGGQALFWIFAAIMAAASIAGATFFPQVARHIPSDDAERTNAHLAPLNRAVWYVIAAVALLCMVQAMTLSFFERVGMARGFGREAVTTALVIYGLVTIVPGPLAGLLEKRLAATTVISVFPVLQAVFAMVVTHTSSFPLFAACGAMMAFTIIFTHTFAFGLLARLDPSGRAAAATPAMLMVGSAIAPFASGTLVKFIGFEAIGYAAVVLVALELLLFNLARRAVRTQDLRALDPAAAL